jgi:hypothetical protein
MVRVSILKARHRGVHAEQSANVIHQRYGEYTENYFIHVSEPSLGVDEIPILPTCVDLTSGREVRDRFSDLCDYL